MKKSFLFSFVALLIAFNSCTEEEITSRDYPRVLTRGVVNVSADGATFKGEIIFTSAEVEDCGFLWTDEGFPKLGEADKLSLGPGQGEGAFEARVERNMEDGATYSMRAYAVSADNIVYGEMMEFVSQGCKIEPVITDFSPQQGSEGDLVTITGNFFSARKFSNKVFFGDVAMEVIEANEDEILVRLFDSPQTGEVEITVISNGNPTVSSEQFTLE